MFTWSSLHDTSLSFTSSTMSQRLTAVHRITASSDKPMEVYCSLRVLVFLEVLYKCGITLEGLLLCWLSACCDTSGPCSGILVLTTTSSPCWYSAQQLVTAACCHFKKQPQFPIKLLQSLCSCCTKVEGRAAAPQRAGVFIFYFCHDSVKVFRLSVLTLSSERGASSAPRIQIKSRISAGVPLRDKKRPARPGPWKAINISQIWILSSSGGGGGSTARHGFQLNGWSVCLLGCSTAD